MFQNLDTVLGRQTGAATLNLEPWNMSSIRFQYLATRIVDQFYYTRAFYRRELLLNVLDEIS